MFDTEQGFKGMNNIVIVGVSGAIGKASVRHLSAQHPTAQIYAFSRSKCRFDQANVHWRHIDLLNEASVEKAADTIDGPLSLILVATGILHDDQTGPEKSLREVSAENFEKLFAVNTMGPALILKHFSPKLDRKHQSVLAVISARVGSISDNRLGGWYAYRASKSALNMVIKTASIEVARRNKNAVLIGLHPGTVDSELSKPFQGNVPEGKLFTPSHSAEMLLKVMKDVSPSDTGNIFDFNGKTISF